MPRGTCDGRPGRIQRIRPLLEVKARGARRSTVLTYLVAVMPNGSASNVTCMTALSSD
jgi:hypothetical protein